MSSRGLRVQLASYNANQQFEKDALPGLTEWLVPTLTESKRSGYATQPDATHAHDLSPREAPDMYAVALQEFAPLSAALGGLVSADAAAIDDEIRRTIRLHQSVVRPDRMYDPLELGGGPENYVKIGEVLHGGLALFVYARERRPRMDARAASAAQRVREVRTAYVGTGIGGVMGNKGAVGVRVRVASADAKAPDEVLTFVCAHLAAHDHNVARRNADWKAIVERLVFDSASVQPLIVLQDDKVQAPLRAIQQVSAGRTTLTPRPLDDEEYSLYDTHHLFVLGDLNYRVGTGVEGVSLDGHEKRYPPIDAAAVRAAQRSFQASQWTALRPYDQLLKERFATPPRTMHGLYVPSMEQHQIPPTYKYKARGEMEQLSQKRLPGWPDRLLWASSDAAHGSHALRCELYRSLMRYTLSDHKPITAIVELPRRLAPGSEYLPVPFSLHPHWRLWRTIGRALDRVVGLVWMLLLTSGYGSLWFALLEVAALACLAWYYLPSAQGVPWPFSSLR